MPDIFKHVSITFVLTNSIFNALIFDEEGETIVQFSNGLEG